MIAAWQRSSALLAAAAIAMPLWLAGCDTPRAAVTATVNHEELAPAAAAAPASNVTLYVVRRGWHIDVGFAVSDLLVPLTVAREQFPQAHYVMFGFGDRRYLHARNRALPNLLAALWPGDGLILVTALRGTPQQAFGSGHVAELTLPLRAATAAQRNMVESLELQEGRPQSDGSGPYEGSAYWRSSRRYSAAYTCNTWAAQVLAAAGLPLRVHGVVFAAQLWRPAVQLAGSSRSGEPAVPELSAQ